MTKLQKYLTNGGISGMKNKYHIMVSNQTGVFQIVAEQSRMGLHIYRKG